MYKCKDNGKLYNLMDAIDYWCDNYDYERVQFKDVFTFDAEVKDMAQLSFSFF